MIYAYSVAELGVMLAEAAQGVVLCDFGDWITHWDDVHIERFPTEAQGRASLLIYLIESDQLTAKECNQRLSTD